MLYMVTTTYPLNRANEIGKVYMERMKKPKAEHVNRVGMWLAPGGKGVKSWTIYEVENGHEDEGYKEIGSRHSEYFHIEGFEMNIEPVLKPEDALSLIGMAPPA